MLSRTQSVAFVGTQAHIVDIEVHVQGGLPAFAIVGMPAKSVREADQRVRAALASSGESWPNERVVANLAPGALRKEGTHFDLAIALGLLAAKGKLPAGALDGWIVVGELALDGSVRQVPGTLAAAMTCKSGERKGIICPVANAPEGRLVDGIEVVPVSSLGDCIGFFRGSWDPPPLGTVRKARRLPLEDMSEVRGHRSAKRAAEIAAAGGHNLLLIGPPGSGKTMLARRFPGIMPPMSRQESLEVTRVYSVAGLLDERATLIEDRPFRSPHHHVSLAGLIGGGTGMARPGEVSFAHRTLALCPLREIRCQHD